MIIKCLTKIIVRNVIRIKNDTAIFGIRNRSVRIKISLKINLAEISAVVKAC